DEVLAALTERRGQVHAQVVAPPLETCVVTRSKRRTYETLAGAVATPHVFSDVDEIDDYPVFVKPDRSQGSQGARLAYDGAAGRPTLLEVGPRVAGTMAVHRVLGVNFPLLTLYEHARERVTIQLNELAVVLDRALANRYRHNLDYSVVYVDLDDTLVVRGEI